MCVFGAFIVNRISTVEYLTKINFVIWKIDRVPFAWEERKNEKEKKNCRRSVHGFYVTSDFMRFYSISFFLFLLLFIHIRLSGSQWERWSIDLWLFYRKSFQFRLMFWHLEILSKFFWNEKRKKISEKKILQKWMAIKGFTSISNWNCCQSPLGFSTGYRLKKKMLCNDKTRKKKIEETNGVHRTKNGHFSKRFYHMTFYRNDLFFFLPLSLPALSDGKLTNKKMAQINWRRKRKIERRTSHIATNFKLHNIYYTPNIFTYKHTHTHRNNGTQAGFRERVCALFFFLFLFWHVQN